MTKRTLNREEKAGCLLASIGCGPLIAVLAVAGVILVVAAVMPR